MRIVGDVRVGGRPGRSTPTRHERSMSSARVRVGVTGVSISGVVIVLKGTIVGRGWTTGATRRSVHCQSPLAVRIRSGHRGGTLYAPTVDSATPGKLSRRTSFEVNSTGKEDFPSSWGSPSNTLGTSWKWNGNWLSSWSREFEISKASPDGTIFSPVRQFPFFRRRRCTRMSNSPLSLACKVTGQSWTLASSVVSTSTECNSNVPSTSRARHSLGL